MQIKNLLCSMIAKPIRMASASKPLACAFAALSIASCTADPDILPFPSGDPTGNTSQTVGAIREDTGEVTFNKVLILASLGYNNLQSDLAKNIDELCQGTIPGEHSDRAVFVFRHASVNDSDFSTPTNPHILRLYSNGNTIVRDTIKMYGADVVSASSQTLNDALSFISNRYKSKSYGLVLSSHASGWMPNGYSASWESSFWAAPRANGSSAVETEPAPWQLDDDHPLLTKSVGIQSAAGNMAKYGMDVDEFVEAFPMHLDYLILDACLCGSIELAYALRNYTDYIVASPTETLTYGHVYETMCDNLLYNPDLEQGLIDSCDQYYQRYSAMSGPNKSATIALYRTKYMEELAAAMAKVIDGRQGTIASLSHSIVQAYNYNYDEFFDMRDIVASAGASKEDLAEVDAVLQKMVPYKAATDYFITASRPIAPDRYSGLSMYLPYGSRSKLNEFYKKLEWNKAVQLLPE